MCVKPVCELRGQTSRWAGQDWRPGIAKLRGLIGDPVMNVGERRPGRLDPLSDAGDLMALIDSYAEKESRQP